MTEELILSITKETCNGQVFLAVHISDVILLKTKEKDLFNLFQQECGEVQKKCLIKASRSLDVIKKIISSKRWKWKDRTPFFNPFSLSQVHIEAESIDSTIVLSGVLTIDKEAYPFSSIEFLFPGPPVWGICKHLIFVLPKDLRIDDFEEVYPTEKKLSGLERELFIQKKHETDLEIIWKGKPAEPIALEVFPCLKLTDKQGAFASLWMEYSHQHVSFWDKKTFPGRNFSDEKAWEKDLLETGFIRKELGSSQYYCPMDKVSKTLSFLLELGWKIEDANKKRVIKLTRSTLSFEEKGKDLLLKGSFQYADHQVSLNDVMGVFTRREHFISLSPDSIGWLSDEDSATLQDLTETEVITEGRIIKKHQLGLLEGLTFSNESTIAPLLHRLQTALKGSTQKDLLFQGKLHPYQEEGRNWLNFLQTSGFSGLLADEMGLGKTIQTLSFLSNLSCDKPILIVAPTSLIFNWKKEWETFIPHKKLHVHQGPSRLDASLLQEKEAILTSYSLLRIDHLIFTKLSCCVIILDEAQVIKNPESQLAKVSFLLKADMKLCLTGTPIENRADDLWSLFHFLEPELLGDQKDFIAELSSSEVDARYRQKIQKKVRPFILRRRKEEVLQDMPEKIEQCVWVEMEPEQKAFYEEYLHKTKQGLLRKVSLEGASSHRMEILEAILRLRQICCHPLLVGGEEISSAKLDQVMLDLEEALENKRKVLIYSQFTQLLQLVKKRLEEKGWSYVYLDGETKDREKVVFSFQNDPNIPIFLISLKAGGVGLNLTAADYVFLLDPWWNEAVEQQAIDRAHRLGRKEAVIARRYIVAETIEEKMMKLKKHKSSLAKNLLDFEVQEAGFGLNDLIELLS